MTEALLNEPQIPTDGKAAAQPDVATTKVVVTPVPDASKDAAPEKQQVPVSTEAGKKDATPPSPPKSLLAEPEKKPDGTPPSDKKLDGVEGDKKIAPTVGPPEKYEWKNDGDLKVAAPVLTAYEKAAREAGLNQDAAQKMLDSLRTTVHQNAVQRHEAQVKEWADSLSAHPTLGGDKLEETGANMRLVMAEFGSPALQKLLMDTGLEFHPEIVGMLSAVRKKVGGDRIVTGAPPKGNAGDQAKQFFDAMPKG